MNSIGIPKEIKTREKRVGLTPRGAALLTAEGCRVFVEAGAGAGSGYGDRQYRDAGADILPDTASVYAHAALIQKVKEPQPAEYGLLRHDQTLFGFLHLASPKSGDLIRVLMHSGITAIGFETVEKEGRRPLLEPMSRIAGALSVLYAGYLGTCFKAFGSGREERLRLASSDQFFDGFESVADAYPKIDRSTGCGPVIVFGGGIAGCEAARVALELGGPVTVVELSAERRIFLEERFGREVRIVDPGDKALEELLEDAEVLVGSVHVRGKRAALVLDPETFLRISRKKPKLIMDIAIDQGGNFPEAEPTTYERPLMLDSAGNLRFSVPNIPSLAGRAATCELEAAAMPYTLALARGRASAFREFPELREAVNIEAGQVRLETVREVHQL